MPKLLLLFSIAARAAARSSGAAVCDAINVCESGVCPEGMELVGPPVRTDTYLIETDKPTYFPNELIEIRIRVTQPQIQAMRNAGKPQCVCTQTGEPRENRRCPGNVDLMPGWTGSCDCGTTARRCDITTTPVLEQSKYLGVLLYAVQDGDEQEAKVGAWEMPLESAPRFAPMEGPTCDGKALVQTSALAKRYLERFWFRAPAAGTGPIVVRALLKQGETLGGGFYWPSAGNGNLAPPQNGVAGGDLVLSEAAVPTPALQWVRGNPGLSCDAVCAAAWAPPPR